jgi:hypothetical protein
MTITIAVLGTGTLGVEMAVTEAVRRHIALAVEMGDEASSPRSQRLSWPC